MKQPAPAITNCSAGKCAYNYSGACRTFAVNIGGPDPLCDTYFTNGKKGGIIDMVAKVGACRVEHCMHNKSFECTAPGVEVLFANDIAECTTFQKRL